MTDLSDKLVAERRARLAAERLLELKSRELFAANRKLSDHALALSREIVMHRQSAQTAANEAEELRGEYNRVQSDLQKATYSLNLAEHRLWLALETIRDGFAIFDANRKLVIANSAYMAVFDGLEEIGPGVHVRDMMRIGLEEGIFDPEGQSPGSWIEEMEARWRAKVIEPKVLRLWNDHYIRLVDRHGSDGGIVSLALDITEATRHEARLREARQKAEAASRAKSAFLANMSHELRTPMNGVVGMAELLSESSLNEEQRLYAETIRSSGEALLYIINDVLDYSKLEAEKLQLHPEPFELERLVHEVIMVLSPVASRKGVALGAEFDVGLPVMLTGDPGRIRQILTNLAGNAVKFTDEGHVLIRVIAEPGGGEAQRLRIEIEDTGIGIPEALRDHIFGEFNQVEDARNRKFEGTGLGLAITSQLVRLMGGEITVNSVEGEGSCFTITLDLGLVEGGAVSLPDRGAMSRALVIERDELTRAVLGRQLAALGFDVQSAATIATAKAAGADIVFVDGRSVAEAGFPPRGADRAPVILVAGSSGAADGGSHSDRVAAKLTKPLVRKDLFAAIEAAAKIFARPMALTAPLPRPSGKLRVLAAEDNRTNQLVFSKMVKDLPLDLTFAGNGREAVELYEELLPEMVFMDISMPEMDGKEATERIRALEAGRGLPRRPIVALTAHAMAGDEQDILASGLDRYLTKPLKKVAIREAIEEFFPDLLGRAEPDVRASGTDG